LSISIASDFAFFFTFSNLKLVCAKQVSLRNNSAQAYLPLVVDVDVDVVV